MFVYFPKQLGKEKPQLLKPARLLQGGLWGTPGQAFSAGPAVVRVVPSRPSWTAAPQVCCTAGGVTTGPLGSPSDEEASPSEVSGARDPARQVIP